MDAERDHVVKYPDSPLRRTKDERRRTGKRMVDLTLNETFYFLDLYLKCGKGETRRAGATTEEKSMCGTRNLHAEDGHHDDGLESSTHTTGFAISFFF